MPTLGADRPVFYRERAANMYSPLVYAASWVSRPESSRRGSVIQGVCRG